MSKFFSVLLAARAPGGLHGPVRELPISDFEIEEGQRAAARFTAHGGILFPPQLIIAESEKEAEEKMPILIAKYCPPEDGWVNHRWATCDISEERERYRRKRFSRDQPSQFFTVSVIGFKYDADCLREHCFISGALSAESEVGAYTRFRKDVIEKLLKGQPWVGGLARVQRMTLTDFSNWKHFWIEAGALPPHFRETPHVTRLH